MNVLITGGTGFIGFHIAKSLSRENVPITLVDIKEEEEFDAPLNELLKQPNVSFVKSDLLQKESLTQFGNDFTHIIHLAAIVGVQNVLNNSFNVLKNNTEMTINLIEFAKSQKNLERFLFASTSEVYAGTLERGLLDIPSPENSSIVLPSLESPRTSYMLSKLYGEALCQQSNLPFTTIRPHNIYGPRMGMRHVIPELLQKAYFSENGTINVFSTDHTRTFCFISDAVDMVLKLMREKSAENRTFNIGIQGPEISIGNLAKLIIECVGRNLEIKPMPSTEGSPERRAPDTSNLHSVIQFREQTTISEGLEACFDWYKKYHFDI